MSGRIVGVDLARAVAIAGMFAVHIGPTGGEDALGQAYALPHGRSALLFVVVAGVGISLLSSSRRASRRHSSLTLLWRAALLLPVGLALQELQHGAAVILQSYALLFVLAIVLLHLSTRWLAVLAVLSATVGSAGYVWAAIHSPAILDRPPITATEPVLDIVHRLVISGPYPLVTWLAPFILGIILGRMDLRSSVLRRRLLVGGVVVAVLSEVVSGLVSSALGVGSDPVGWQRLVMDAPHSQMPLWLLGSSASAAAILGGCLLLADALPRTTRPLVQTGQLALTVYVGHLLALAAAPEMLTSGQVGPAVLVLGLFLAVSVVFSAVWRRFFRRGPLELALQLPSSARHARSS